MSRKTIVISWDGATLDVARPLIEAGRMPHLKMLAEEGVIGQLRSTIPPVTLPVFPTFITGVNSGVHGIFDLRKRAPDAYKSIPVTAMESPVPKLWQIISSHGLRVCIGNVPGSYPPEEVNGCMLCGKLTPSYETNFTWPRELKIELEEQGIPHRFLVGAKYSEHDRDTFFLNACALIKRYRDIALYLIRQKDWDYFQFAFNAPDGVQHWYWKHMDATHPAHDPDAPEQYREAIFSVYEKLDEAIGRIVETARSRYGDVNVILFSDHGFGPLLGNINVNRYLLDLGFLRLKSGPWTLIKRLALRLGWNGRNAIKILDRLGLTKKKIAVPRREGERKRLRWAEDLLKSTFVGLQDVDWCRTVAYSSGHWGQVFLNVAGREPRGIVQPGAEYLHVRDEVIEALRELRDPYGDPLITETYTRDEAFTGDRITDGPDIVFFAQEGRYITHGQFNFAMQDVVSAPVAGKSGSHRRMGLYVMHGPDIQRTASAPVLDILDLTPTVLHLLGQPVPRYMEGTVPIDLLSYEAPIQFEDLSLDTHTEHAIDGAEKELIEERLRDLGYIS